jgi:uncharacterized protein YyaL (SSP411 family)
MGGLGLLALGEATGEPVWATRAEALGAATLARFLRPDGLVVTSTADANLILPAIDLDDHEMPSGTSSAYALLAQLGKTDQRFAKAATKILVRTADKIQLAPAAWASLERSPGTRGRPGLQVPFRGEPVMGREHPSHALLTPGVAF